ncbi:hypothetical protein BCR41DRAFT_376179, partial [Lobosporangium transversale]
TYYPRKYVFNWINGENQRLIRNSSQSSFHTHATAQFAQHLLNRNYPSHVINNQLRLHSYDERNTLLYPAPSSQKNDTIIKKMFLHNIPGRDKLEQFGRMILRDIHTLKPARYENTQTTWIIYKGSNLRNQLNTYNKKILQSAPIRSRL